MSDRSPWTPYLFLFPALLVLGIVSFWPALQAIYYSLTSYDLLSPPHFHGLQNYIDLAGDRLFWKVLGNTLVYLAVAVPALIFLPLILAILVNQKLKGIHTFRVLYYLPVVVSVVVAGLAWKWIYAENGLLNFLLSLLTFREIRIPWLTDPNLALLAIIAVTVWKGLGYYMVIYLAGLQSIPQNVYEAAEIDGSDGWQKHWDITVPLMRPYLFLVGVLAAIASMKVFEEIYAISPNGGPANSTKTLVYYLYEKGFSDLDMGYAAAIGVVLFAIVVGLSLSAARLLHIRGIQL
ncbi:carbohydrate ABC transporter permease [Synechococcus sp. PCC 7336]|uniref:carbohydrate ABC transporter permease n=1 Tax=Synechococcus sp. PCC 7336 TaxID=195250 RepID=UPI00034B7B9E|nr:sugar ABC transporter permease [Synechococcus sp. PCC 7336]